jgi:hypothetical protein
MVERSLLGAMIASLDPRNPKDRTMLEWLSEVTILGGISSRTFVKPRLVIDNVKREEVADVSTQ